MAPIDPRLVKAKRFPVHAAVDRCNVGEVRHLVDADAEFHLARRLPDTELAVTHTACSALCGTEPRIVEILKYLIKMGTPIDALDCAGQTPMHHAVCHALSAGVAAELAGVLLDAGADPGVARKTDGAAPLHLAAMLGRTEVARTILHHHLLAQKSPKLLEQRDADGRTPAQVAERFGAKELADYLTSPRQKYQPASLTLPDIFHDLESKVQNDASAIKIKDDLINWREEGSGNSLLHLACWKGDVKMARAIFDCIKARKSLVNCVNAAGATPLMMAILGGQDNLVEEFFMNRHAKKLVDMSSCIQRLNDTGETVIHLLFRYSPFVHPKFVLKRKDLTFEALNAVDNEGYSAALRCAARNRGQAVHKVLSSKNVKDEKLLDLSLKATCGRSLLHFIIANVDNRNFRNLLDSSNFTEEMANDPDPVNNKSPLSLILESGDAQMIRDLLLHPTASSKFRMSGSNSRTLLHVLAEKGDESLWRAAISRQDANDVVNVVDESGMTPLMRAVTCKKHSIVKSVIGDQEILAKFDLSMKDKNGNNLFMLLIKHMDEEELLDTLLRNSDMRHIINETNKESETPLLLITSSRKYSLIPFLLKHERLKNDKSAGVIDVNKVNGDGDTCLNLLLVARAKLSRLEQTYFVKNEVDLAKGVRAEFDYLWDVVKLILERVKEIFGSTMVQGRDGGSTALRKQMAVNKIIRSPVPDEVVREFARLYIFKKAAPKPIAKETSDESGSTAKVKVQQVAEVNGLVSEDSGKCDKKTDRTGQPDKKAQEVRDGLIKVENSVNVKKSFARQLSEGNSEPERAKVATKAKNRKSLLPMISLDDLRDPAAFEAMVNNVADSIAEERKKLKKKIPKAKNDTQETPKDNTEPETTTGHTMNDGVTCVTDGTTNDTPANDSSQQNNKTNNESDKEWSPSSPTPTRRRLPSFNQTRKRTTSGSGKPPIPSGKSPPPPDEPERPDRSKFKFGPKNEDLVFPESVTTAPKRNSVHEHQENKKASDNNEKDGLDAPKSNASPRTRVSEADFTFANGHAGSVVSTGCGVEMVSVATQTDFKRSRSASTVTQTCCPACGMKK